MKVKRKQYPLKPHSSHSKQIMRQFVGRVYSFLDDQACYRCCQYWIWI